MKFVGGTPYVHGGASAVNDMLRKLDIETNSIRSGAYDTTPSMWRPMVLVGHVNTELVAMLNKMGASAVGPSGLSAKLNSQQKSRSVDEWNWVMSASHRINVKLFDSMMIIGLHFLLRSHRIGPDGEDITTSTRTRPQVKWPPP